MFIGSINGFITAYNMRCTLWRGRRMTWNCLDNFNNFNRMHYIIILRTWCNRMCIKYHIIRIRYTFPCPTAKAKVCQSAFNAQQHVVVSLIAHRLVFPTRCLSALHVGAYIYTAMYQWISVPTLNILFFFNSTYNKITS